MAKQSGLGDGLLVGGYDLSGDTGAVDNVSGGPALLEMTGIDKYAFERQGGVRDGKIEWTGFFNDAAGQNHPVLSTLPRTDVAASYLRGRGIGSPVASAIAKQVGYDGTRGDDGSLTFKVEAQSNSYGVDWGVQLTAGLRTDTTATNGTSLDTTASLSFGGQAFLHVTALTGTNVVVKIQDSADNSSFSDVTGLTFTSVTAAHTAERLAVSNTSTIRRYVRVATTGTFTSATFVVGFTKNEVAGVVF